MKNLEELHYYEILQIPVDASSNDIKQAYDEAISMYGEDSMATYTLFSIDDRDELLLRIEEAYSTLIDESKRAAYDKELNASVRMDDPALSQDLQEPPSLSNLPVCASEACQRELIETIDNYADKIEMQNFSRQDIRNRLKFIRIQEKIHDQGSLAEVGSELQEMLTDIETTSIRKRRNIFFIILSYTLLSIAGFVLLTITNAFMLPGFNVPYTVLFMGLAGCIASMYLKLPNIRAEKPLRYDPTIWFIICPLVAVILAAISYGILQILISFVGFSLSEDAWLFRVLAFIVGFINWVYIYDRLTGEQDNGNPNSKNSQSGQSRPV